MVCAQTFPLRLERSGVNGVCDNLTANKMSVDPTTGRVTLENVNNLTCLPDGVAGLGNVNIDVPLGPHPSGTSGIVATVQGIPAGATCTLRGPTNTTDSVGNGFVGGAGWTDGSTLCTSCAPSVSRTLTFTNATTTDEWKFRLEVQCSINSNGYAVLAPVVSSGVIRVSPATVAAGSCVFGEQVPPGHDGLSVSANRQLITTASDGAFGGNGIKDVTLWTSLFGTTTGGFVSPRTLPSPGSPAQGYGFPGTFTSVFQIRVDRGKFIALKFRAPTPDPNPTGNPLWTGIASNLGSAAPQSQGAPATYAIAPCPGQFRSVSGAPLPPQCVKVGSSKSILTFVFVAPGVAYVGDKCPLLEGQNYYFNIITADPEESQGLTFENSFCTSSYCNVKPARGSLSIEQNYP